MKFFELGFPGDFEDLYPSRDAKEKCKLKNGDKVHIMRQIPQQLSNFSTRYYSPNDILDPSREFSSMPFNGKINKIFGFATSKPSTYSLYIPRTYGQWWNKAPSGRREKFMVQTLDLIVGDDFADYLFETPVYPLRVYVFEAYNPGSIIGIWAEDYETKVWHNLWRGPVQHTSATHRIFGPSLRKAFTFRTNLLRFELSHGHLKYYPQLEGCHLIGCTEMIEPLSSSAKPYLQTLYYNITNMKQTPEQLRDNDNACLKVLDEEFSSLKKNIKNCWKLYGSEEKYSWIKSRVSSIMRSSRRPGRNRRGRTFESRIELMPTEILRMIYKYLDVMSLFYFSKINPRFESLTRDAKLYRGVDLKPHWSLINSEVIEWLTPRCTYLQRLDMSWCGNSDNSLIGSNDIGGFLQTSGKKLTHLRLNCCQFVTDNVVITIARVCRNLKELCLNNCQRITPLGFTFLKTLESLERLELYRTRIGTQGLCEILVGNPKMRHLNIAETHRVQLDDVAKAIQLRCRDIETLDCWCSRTLTPSVILCLSSCNNIREIDFGWCPPLNLIDAVPEEAHNAFKIFIKKFAMSLEKIGMTAQRDLIDDDLEPLIAVFTLLQLHLGGTTKVKPSYFVKILNSCLEMQMFDITGCKTAGQDISLMAVVLMRQKFPWVTVNWVQPGCTGFHHGDVVRTP